MSMDDIAYMDIAKVVAMYSTCKRLNVGAVIVKDKRIVSTGYNGAPAGLLHCTHDDLTPCDRAVHAEVNAIAFAAKHGISTNHSVLYSTHLPCLSCAQIIINAGIKEVNYGNEYRNKDGKDLLWEAEIHTNKIRGSRVFNVSPE